MRRPHHICPYCGTYQGEEIIEVEEKKKPAQ
jgi:ribosomal protein L32